MKHHTKTLGFLPRSVLEQFLAQIASNRGIGAKDAHGHLLGYILYAAYPDRIRIVHLCVSTASRQKGVAKSLVNQLAELATTQTDIRLHCRRDFPAHRMWPRLGFVPLEERAGRSRAGHALTFWRRPLTKDDRFDLFRARTSDETLDVAIDAQILFDFHAPESDTTKPSKALLADFLADSLTLFLTDEIYVEIDRKDDAPQRRLSRERARGFPSAAYDPHLRIHFANCLKTILSCKTPSQESDIQHIAKTAAARIPVFVTRDEYLLKKAPKISELTGLQVVRPTELIIRLHELGDNNPTRPGESSACTLSGACGVGRVSSSATRCISTTWGKGECS